MSNDKTRAVFSSGSGETPPPPPAKAKRWTQSQKLSDRLPGIIVIWSLVGGVVGAVVLGLIAIGRAVFG